ncbi:hypothetical protein M1316_01335 [Candidatus Parvarchaeota archaeon]|nr:hypothetical protein [Candidatus Parvarchaeota archaeon]
MRYLGILSIVSLLFISISIANAIPPSGNVPISLTIPSNAVSFYNISFYNNLASTVNISLNIGQAKIQYGFFFSNMGVKPSQFSLAPNKSESVLFSFVPTGQYTSLPQALNISYTQNGVNRYFIISATIVPITNMIYHVYAPSSIVPTSPLKFNASVLNQLGQDVPVPISYSLNNSQGKTVSLSSQSVVLTNLGVDQFSFSLPLNSTIAPGQYTLYVYTNYGGQTSLGSANINISAYSAVLTSSSSNINIFGGTSTMTVVNTGNENLSNSDFTLPVNGFNSLFLTAKSVSLGTAQLSASGVTSSVNYLMPGQALTISYSISYLPIYILIVIIIVVIAIFLYLNRKISISKEVVEHKVVGGFVDVKIALKIKNVSKKSINDLEISDFVPPHALKVSSVGPKAGRISKVADGLSISWKETDLQPNDEVLLMYEMKSKVGIIGSINLKPAICLFRVGNKELKRKSNSLILNIR